MGENRKLICALSILLSLAIIFVAGCSPKKRGGTTAQEQDKRDVVASRAIVAAAHPLAAQAGMEILQTGGNAIDAAVATSFALGVVEPNATGLGGGGFAVIYIAKENKCYVIDYRETAPANARPDMYELNAMGRPVNDAAATGHKAVAVPGQLRGMEILHKMFGSKTWEELVLPAVKLSESGFKAGKTLSSIVLDESVRLQKAPSAKWFERVFFKDALPVQPGDVVTNPELTESLKKIAKGGADVFYKGEIADAVIREFARNGAGFITKEDLEDYRAVVREPVQSNYRGYTIFTVPPPSSGGLALIELLNILEQYDVMKMGLGSPDFLHIMIEAQKLAFADREKYLADPAFSRVPITGLADKRYARERRQLIDMRQAAVSVKPGEPKYESGSTTSFAVVDQEGNMVSITQTINHFMGAGVVPDGTGIMLNDEMDDFAPNPGALNSPEAGKRPLSSMTPVIVIKDGKPFMAIGSPGATRIISALAEIIVHSIDFKMDLQPAIVAPRFHNGNTVHTDVEARIPGEVLRELEARGHKFNVRRDFDLYFGGAQGIIYAPDGKLHGGGDPRRDGIAVGY